MVSERFDRRVDRSGVIKRLHQEDLCQAMGNRRAFKYQAEGGPSAADIAQLFTRAVDLRDLKAARDRFAKALIFNWLVAGTDAHAKNYSLIHLGNRVLLAPLYDLTSAAIMFDPETLHYHGKLAMEMGGEYRLRQIDARHLRRAADDIGVDPDCFVAAAADFADRLPGAFDQAVAEINDVTHGAESVLGPRIAQRLAHARSGVR